MCATVTKYQQYQQHHTKVRGDLVRSPYGSKSAIVKIDDYEIIEP